MVYLRAKERMRYRGHAERPHRLERKVDVRVGNRGTGTDLTHHHPSHKHVSFIFISPFPPLPTLISLSTRRQSRYVHPPHPAFFLPSFPILSPYLTRVPGASTPGPQLTGTSNKVIWGTLRDVEGGNLCRSGVCGGTLVVGG